MQYRLLGKTGMKASMIGLGTEHLDGKEYGAVEETIQAALEYGINMMDLFMPGSDIRQKIGKALGDKRNQMIIQGHIGSTDIGQQYSTSRDLAICQKYFEGLMRDLGTDYIDFGMLYLIDNEETFDQVFHSDLVRYAQRLKQDGTIRGIGASSHDPVIAKKIVETGVVDLLMFSINPAFDMFPADMHIFGYFANEYDKNRMVAMDPRRLELYRTCETLDIPITVMKSLGGGRLLSEEYSPFSTPLTVHQCVHYALSRPSVRSVLVGCQSRTQVEEAIAYLTTDPASLDYTEALRSMSSEFQGSCVYCNHCQPCPAGIDIAAVTKYADIAQMDKNAASQGIGQHYRALAAHASDCIQCGSCEKRCPFSVPVMDNMERAKGIFQY